MSKGEMHRLRVAATAAMTELTAKETAAFQQHSADYDKIRAARTKAAVLVREAGKKEEAEILNATTATAPATLTDAANKLEAEVARLKASTAHLKQLGDALKAGTDAVGLFKAAKG